MAEKPKIIKAYNFFIDGGSYAGLVEEVSEPKKTLKVEEWRGGGMDAGIDIDNGMEKMEMEITFAEHSPKVKSYFGKPNVSYELRQALAADEKVIPKVISVVGQMLEDDSGSSKAGEKGALKVKVGGITYYKEVIGGQVVTDIDILNMKRVVNGVDQLAAQRAAVGL